MTEKIKPIGCWIEEHGKLLAENETLKKKLAMFNQESPAEIKILFSSSHCPVDNVFTSETHDFREMENGVMFCKRCGLTIKFSKS